MNLYLDAIKFTVENGDSHTHIIPNVLESFIITASNINFLFENKIDI